MPTSTLERRILEATQLRAVSNGDGKAPRVEGLAAKFNSLSHDLGGFRERVTPTAFDKALKNGADVRALVNHDPSKIIGRTKAGTLRLWTDSVGLRFSCDLPDTGYARDLYKSIERGDTSQCSFSFRADPDGEDWDQEQIDDDGDGIPEVFSTVRSLRSVALYDVSAVTFPAYEDTSVSARAIEYARSKPTLTVPVRRVESIAEANARYHRIVAEGEVDRKIRRARVIAEITS